MNIFVFTDHTPEKQHYIHCVPRDWDTGQMKLFEDIAPPNEEIIIHRKNVEVNKKIDVIILDSFVYEFTAKALHFAEEKELPLLIVNHSNSMHLPKIQGHPIIFKKESEVDNETIVNLINLVKHTLPRGSGQYFTKFFSVDELREKHQRLQQTFTPNRLFP